MESDLPIPPDSGHSKKNKTERPIHQTSEIYTNFLQDKKDLFDKLISILPNFEEDIRHVVNVIMNCVDIDKRKHFIAKVNVTFRDTLKRIILTQNQLLNLDAHPIGIELSNYFNSTNAQTILNVKHLSVSMKSVEYITPSLNSVILHQQTDNKTWFRLRCRDVNAVVAHLKCLKFNSEYIILNDEILEVVYTTDNRSGLATERMYYDIYKNTFDADPNVLEIIFYSNCRCLIDIETQNYNLIYSNIFKFYYCHRFNKLDTTYSPTELEGVLFLQIQCYMLMIHQNFNTNNSRMLEPLTLLASEKNTAALMASQNMTFATEASRDTHVIGEGSAIGGKNKSKLIIKIV
jgi:hypothetical protein